MDTVEEPSKLFMFFTKAIERIAEVVALLMIWLLLGIGLLLGSGYRSSSLVSWVIAVVSLSALYVAGEVFVECLRNIKSIKIFRLSIDEKTQGKAISGIRISYLLAESITLIGLLCGSCWLIYKYFG